MNQLQYCNHFIALSNCLSFFFAIFHRFLLHVDSRNWILRISSCILRTLYIVTSIRTSFRKHSLNFIYCLEVITRLFYKFIRSCGVFVSFACAFSCVTRPDSFSYSFRLFFASLWCSVVWWVAQIIHSGMLVLRPELLKTRGRIATNVEAALGSR